MNHDDTIWSTIGHAFCSFKVKTQEDKDLFCRNPYNLTGMCSRHTCPLANQTYATVIEHDDELYLYIKTAERAHLPRRQWEKVKLSASFPVALQQIDENLQWWDRRFVHRVKARCLRLKQFLLRRRKLMLEPQQELVSVNKRQEFKLVRREAKAEQAARIELELEKELLERLRRGTYDDVINVNLNQKAFDRLMDEQEAARDAEADEEGDEDEEAMADDEYVEDDEETDEEADEEEEDDADADSDAGQKRRQPSAAEALRERGRARLSGQRRQRDVQFEREDDSGPSRPQRHRDLDW
jgi:protein MAK16